MAVWAPSITCKRTDVLSQAGWEMLALAGFLCETQTHNLSHNLHTFASPYMSRVPFYAGDETATCPWARTGTIRAFRDQLPFTHVFIISEPPHTHTHTYNKTNPLWQLRCLSKCSVTEYYLLQQRTELHNSPLSSLTESPHLYPTYTHPHIDLITSTRTHTHTCIHTIKSHFLFPPRCSSICSRFAVQNLSSHLFVRQRGIRAAKTDVMDSPASGLRLGCEKHLLIRETESLHHVEVVISR